MSEERILGTLKNLSPEDPLYRQRIAMEANDIIRDEPEITNHHDEFVEAMVPAINGTDDLIDRKVRAAIDLVNLQR